MNWVFDLIVVAAAMFDVAAGGGWFADDLLSGATPNPGISVAVTAGSANGLLLAGAGGASLTLTTGTAAGIDRGAGAGASVAITAATADGVEDGEGLGASVVVTVATAAGRDLGAGVGASVAITGGTADDVEFGAGAGASAALTAGTASGRLLAGDTGASLAVTAGTAGGGTGSSVTAGDSGATITLTAGAGGGNTSAPRQTSVLYPRRPQVYEIPPDVWQDLEAEITGKATAGAWAELEVPPVSLAGLSYVSAVPEYVEAGFRSLAIAPSRAWTLEHETEDEEAEALLILLGALTNR